MLLTAGQEYDRLIFPVKTILHMIACYPLERGTHLGIVVLQKIYLLVIFVLTTSLVIAIVAEAIKLWGDIDQVSECVLCMMESSLTVPRLVVFTMYYDNMLYVVQYMRRDWTEATKKVRFILRARCLLTFRLAACFITILIFSMLSFVIVAISMVIKGMKFQTTVMPFRGYYFIYENDTSVMGFQYTFYINVASGALGCFTIAAATTFCLVMVMHAAAKFAVVQQKIEEIDCLDSKARHSIELCVKEHWECIKFADVTGKIINMLTLAHFLITTLFIAIAGYQVSSMLVDDKKRLMKYRMSTHTVLWNLFLFCYSGNRLIIESESIGYSAYLRNWIENKRSISSSLQIIMMRSTKPCTVSAGKIYPMTLQSFTTVLKTSFSYFILLRAMRFKE